MKRRTRALANEVPIASSEDDTEKPSTSKAVPSKSKAAPKTAKAKPKTKRPRKPSPNVQVMIDAVKSSSSRAGVSLDVIREYISANQPNLVGHHRKHLNKAVSSGHLIKTGIGFYKMAAPQNTEQNNAIDTTPIASNKTKLARAKKPTEKKNTAKGKRGKKAKQPDETEDTQNNSKKRSSDEPESKQPSKKRPSRKGPRPEENDDNRLASLIDDCLEKVFESLSIDDLCNVALTCWRLYNAALQFIRRRYPKEAAQIDAADDMMKLDTAPKIMRTFFAKPNIALGNSLSSSVSIDELVASYRAQEKGIEKIRFDGMRNLRPAHGKSLAPILMDTKSAIFSGVKILGEFGTVILQHMPNMEELILSKEIDIQCKEEDKSNWMLQKYPNLEHFGWFLDNELVVSNELMQFIGNNPTINRISLLSRNIKTVSSCISYGIKITDLYFIMGKDFQNQLVELYDICEEDPTLRVHLQIADVYRYDMTKHIKLMLTLKQNIVGLYFDGKQIQKKLAQYLNEFTSLKYLHLPRCGDGVERILTLTGLEEVYMCRGTTGLTFSRIRDTITKLVSLSPKLKKIYFRNNSTELHHFRLKQFDIERKKFDEDIEHLTVYMKTHAKDRLAEFNETKSEYDTFTIKRAETSFVTNPLVNEFLYAKNSFTAASARQISIRNAEAEDLAE